MAILTVGYAAGLIALGVAVLSFLIPNAFILLVAAFAGRERSAATWSVFARELQGTFWPVMLRCDSAAVSRSSPSVKYLVWLRTLAVLLVTVAGVVTPLGLYQAVKLDRDEKSIAFQLVEDTGPFGIGTPARDPDFYYTRVCTEHQTIGGCPFSVTSIENAKNASVLNSAVWKGTYDVRVPYITAEVFSSLHDDHPSSVSGAFDMQWRIWSYSQRPNFNNGSHYPVGRTRYMNSLLLHDTIEPVEGLVVDTHLGGVGFRNHTAPINAALGAEWSEELLFITPETVCVDTNLTLDFQIGPVGTADDYTSYKGLVNISLTDHGGFVDINRTYPAMEMYPGQSDPMLWFRAYKAAWWNNVWTMLYMNVTNPSVGKFAKAFTYLDSEIGRKFYLDPDGASGATYSSLYVTSSLGSYLNFYSGNYSSYMDPRSKYANPWNVTSDNFTDGSLLCQGAGGLDAANMSFLAGSCGLVLGAAKRQDGKADLIAEPGSWWTQPMYTCASVSKAEVKRVTFRWNNTSTGSHLERLSVVNVTEKMYESTADEPYWAVENLHRNLIDMSPLWGLVSAQVARQYANNSNLDFIQKSRLYIPGDVGLGLGNSMSVDEYDNLAAGSAPRRALGNLYGSSDSSFGMGMDGGASTALYSRWQNLSSDAERAANIFNIIYTDALANVVTGTRSLLSNERMPPNVQPMSQQDQKLARRSDKPTPLVSSSGDGSFLVALYESRVAYRWPYAVPALIVVALLGGVLIGNVIVALLGRMASLRTMTFFLNTTSAGRLLSLLDEQKKGSTELTSYGVSQHGSPYLSSHEAERKTPSTQPSSSLHLPTKHWLQVHGTSKINLSDIGQSVDKDMLSTYHYGHGEEAGVDQSNNSGFPSNQKGDYKAVSTSLNL